MIAEGLIYLAERLDEIEALVLNIDTEVLTVATDQATFDAALTDFLNDLNSGLAAIQAKLDAAGTPVDLSAELGQINDAKAAFDAQVAADTTAPAEPAPTVDEQLPAASDTTATTDSAATDAPAPAAPEEF